MAEPYLKPKDIGGKLIRQTIATFRNASIALPLEAPRVWIGVSGGSDSVALLRLLSHYGRRVIQRERIRVLHVNHRWRGLESDTDEAYVRSLCLAWKIPLTVRRLKPPARGPKAGSPEDQARSARREILKSLLRPHDVFLSAHHADDVAETVLWHLLTGQRSYKSEAIRFQDGQTLRPFLQIRKSTLQAFLKEEGVMWQTDRTNLEGNFLRARLRREVFPALLSVFPRTVEHLCALTMGPVRTENRPKPGKTAGLQIVEALLKGLKTGARRPHFEAVAGLRREIHLPKGLRLTVESIRSKPTVIRRWILEETLPKADKEP